MARRLLHTAANVSIYAQTHLYMCVHVYIRAYLADCSTQQLRFDIQSVGVASQVQKVVDAHLLAWLSRGRLRWETPQSQ